MDATGLSDKEYDNELSKYYGYLGLHLLLKHGTDSIITMQAGQVVAVLKNNCRSLSKRELDKKYRRVCCRG